MGPNVSALKTSPNAVALNVELESLGAGIFTDLLARQAAHEHIDLERSLLGIFTPLMKA